MPHEHVGIEWQALRYNVWRSSIMALERLEQRLLEISPERSEDAADGSHGADGETEQVPPSVADRIRVDLKLCQVTIDGLAILVSPDGATFVDRVLRSFPHSLRGKELGVGGRPDRVLRKLSPPVREWIESEGRGRAACEIRRSQRAASSVERMAQQSPMSVGCQQPLSMIFRRRNAGSR